MTMIVSGYSLDLYCDLKNPDHRFREFPHNYTGESGGECRKAARQHGWILNLKDGTAICPKCKRKMQAEHST